MTVLTRLRPAVPVSTVPVAFTLEFGAIPLRVEAKVTARRRGFIQQALLREPPDEPEIEIEQLALNTAPPVEVDQVALDCLFERVAPGITRSLRDAVMQRCVEEAGV
jgi:hypothetical protein